MKNSRQPLNFLAAGPDLKLRQEIRKIQAQLRGQKERNKVQMKDLRRRAEAVVKAVNDFVRDFSKRRGPASKEEKAVAKAIKDFARGFPKLGSRASKFDGKRIIKLHDKNPRPVRSGHGHCVWGLFKSGATYEEYKLAGGRRRDLEYDLKKGNVRVS